MKRLTYLIGHRGASGYEPENTLRSFRAAIRDGANAVEFDLHWSRNGHLVVIHDNAVDRTTNGTGYVSEMALNELKRLYAGGGERIPALQEVVDLLRGKCKLFIEIKAAGIEKDLVNAIAGMEIRKDIVILGTLSSITRIRELDSTLEWAVPSYALGKIRIGSLYKGITAEMVPQFHEEGLILIPQTVEEEEMARLVERGVDGIITNWPKTLVSVVKRLSSHAKTWNRR